MLTITVRTPQPLTIVIVNATFQAVAIAKDTTKLSVMLSPGIYKVRFVNKDRYIEDHLFCVDLPGDANRLGAPQPQHKADPLAVDMNCMTRVSQKAWPTPGGSECSSS